MQSETRPGKTVARLIATVMLLAAPWEGTAAQRPRTTPPPTRPVAKAPVVPQAKAPTATYWAYVGAESADLLHRIRFGPDGATVEKTMPIGELAAEMEGPHGLQVSQDGKWLYMTTGHGLPDGKLWKFETGVDTVVGLPIPLGFFPASIDVTPDGLYTFSANFNLHGEMVPSSISVVYTPTNTEVAQTITCTMPHGSRINASGTKHYSGCMMDDQLVEIDTRTYAVSARFSVAKGKEGPLALDTHAGHAMQHDAPAGGARMSSSCSPTWAQPAAKGSLVYVACNKADEILEVDASSWKVARRIATGVGPYNLAVTPDGKYLLATLKKGAGFEMFDLASGKSVYSDKLSTTLGHGVAVSSDSKYAFVSSEGVGAQPGKVDIFDLVARKKVASLDVGQQASGIAFWKMEPAR
jgi:DNA-binding beta-propeller fold protein YncE